MNGPDTARAQLSRRQTPVLLVGIVGLILWIVAGHGSQQFFRSYLVAFLFWAAIPLGCLGVLMLHHLTGGWWGYPIRRLLEAGSRTLRWTAVLFLPVLFGVPKLYSWTQPGGISNDWVNSFKAAYLQSGFFIARAVCYFAIWLALAYFLNKWSAEQDRTNDPRLAARMSALSGPGLILWGLTITAAAIDWVMSLEPHWFSTIYGMIWMLIAVLAGLCLVILVLRLLSDFEPLKDCVEPSRYIDLGNIMLTFVLLWTYLSFDQLLIIWAGNMKDEIPWYTHRVFGGWAPVAVALIVLHFFVPFFLLLQRTMKRRLRALSAVAALLFLVSFVDVYWLVAPSYDTSPHPHWLDLFAVIGVGGVWLAAFLSELKKWPLLPLHDPRFEGELVHEHGD